MPHQQLLLPELLGQGQAVSALGALVAHLLRVGAGVGPAPVLASQLLIQFTG